MKIDFKTILLGMYLHHDADMIIITTNTVMLIEMRHEWSSSFAENASRLYKQSNKHVEVLQNCMERGKLPGEDRVQACLDVKNALVWIADNIGSFWV